MRQKAIISLVVFSASFRIVDFGFVVVVVVLVPMKSLIPEAFRGSEAHGQSSASLTIVRYLRNLPLVVIQVLEICVNIEYEAQLLSGIP